MPTSPPQYIQNRQILFSNSPFHSFAFVCVIRENLVFLIRLRSTQAYILLRFLLSCRPFTKVCGKSVRVCVAHYKWISTSVYLCSTEFFRHSSEHIFVWEESREKIQFAKKMTAQIQQGALLDVLKKKMRQTKEEMEKYKDECEEFQKRLQAELVRREEVSRLFFFHVLLLFKCSSVSRRRIVHRPKVTNPFLF